MSDEKKKFGKAGCIVGIGAVVLMFAGIMTVCYAARLEADGLFVPGIIMIMLPLIVIPIMTMLPAKLRGVDEVPRKERAIQIFMMLFVVMLVSGFLAAIIIGMTTGEPETVEDALPLIITGSTAAVGFIGVLIMSVVNKRVTGNDSVTIQLFHEEEKSREITEKVLDKLLEGRLPAEERERELERIEKNTVGAMTKEQVEEYENKRHLF